jgi:glycerate-2-kinase
LPDDAEVRFLKSLCAAATAAAAPPRCRPPHLPGERTGRMLVVGAGKASAASTARKATPAPRAAALGLNARAALLGNDAYGFFSAIDSLLVTGPTLTNVNDFHAIRVS